MKHESGCIHVCSRRRSIRRGLIFTGAAWPALGWIDAVLAQAKQNPVLIGLLQVGSRESNIHLLAVLKEGLAALGWKEGSQYVIEGRWAEGRRERLQQLAEELAAKKPALIVAEPTVSVRAAVKAAPATPIVLASGGDPVSAGLAASLARPGGMVTGLSNAVGEVQQKFVELLIEAVPKVRRIGILSDIAASASGKALREALRRKAAEHSVEVRMEEATKPEDIEPAISRLAKHKVEALIVLASGLFAEERLRILQLALAQRWPVIGAAQAWAERGALLSYGADGRANFRRAAYYGDRILKGTKPGELPIEQPTKFELVLNMKTARAFGLTIPQSMLLRAHRVIE